MRGGLASAVTACALGWVVATAAAAQGQDQAQNQAQTQAQTQAQNQAQDSVCASLTERLRVSAFADAPEFGGLLFHYQMLIADRGPEAPYVGATSLRASAFDRLAVTCAGAPRESLAFLMRAFARAGDLDAALAAARRQVEIAGAPSALDSARRDLAVVLVARGAEGEAAAVMRPTRANLSDPALLADAYERATAGSMIFGYDSPLQMALLEAAARNDRRRLSLPRESWETPEEDLAQVLTQLGERRRQRGEADEALATYGEAATLLKVRVERLGRERKLGWETARVMSEDLLAEAYVGLTESAAAKGDRAQAVTSAQAGVALIGGQSFAAPGSGLAGQIATHRFSGDSTARPAAHRLERMADALVAVDEAAFAAQLYEAEAGVFEADPARVADLARAYARLIKARRLQGDLAGAEQTAAKATVLLDRARDQGRPGQFAGENASVLLEQARLKAAQGDRPGACRTAQAAFDLHLERARFPDHKRIGDAVAAAVPELCGG